MPETLNSRTVGKWKLSILTRLKIFKQRVASHLASMRGDFASERRYEARLGEDWITAEELNQEGDLIW
jgi:hypothetical protein